MEDDWIAVIYQETLHSLFFVVYKLWIYYITIIIKIKLKNLKKMCNSYFCATSKNQAFHKYVHYFSSNNSKSIN